MAIMRNTSNGAVEAIESGSQDDLISCDRGNIRFYDKPHRSKAQRTYQERRLPEYTGLETSAAVA